MPKKPAVETPLYVRIPSTSHAKLDRAAEALGVHKKDLVAGLVDRYVDPDSERSLSSLDAIASQRPRESSGAPLVGAYSFRPHDPPEVLNSEQAGAFLQIDERNVIELAEAGTLPGKKLGPVWRFSREALVAWLSTPDKPERR